MSSLYTDRLTRVVFEGFKSIKKCDLKLEEINVLIGSNGAGKSNFISAFTLLQHILVQELSLYVGQSGISSLFFNGTKATERIIMEFYFNKNSYSFKLIPSQSSGLIFEDEQFGYHGNFDNTGSISKGHSESLWERGTRSEDVNRYVIPILRKQQWRVYHFHDTSKNSRIKAEHNLSNNKVLLNDASNLAAFLYRLKSQYSFAYSSIVDSIQLIAPYFKDFELEPNENNNEHIVLRWCQKGSEDILNASQLSDGTLRFICLATLLLQPVELQPATIIVDEPELGLHPYAITVFSELVKKAAVNKQIIVSTQSVELLNQFDAQDVIVVDRSDEGSVFKRLDEDELTEWLNNDYTLGDLWKKNILGGR